MPRDLRWRDQRVGLAATIVLAATVFAILVFARIGRLPGDTYRVHVRTDDARGIISGSDVWLNGQKIGAVRKITFMPAGEAQGARLVLGIDLLERHREAVRKDTRVEIRSGGSLLGAPVVYLSMGSPTAPLLAPGDTVIARDQVDLESVATKYADAAQALPLIATDLKALATLMQSPDGTLGAFFEEGGGTESIELRARMNSIGASVRNERGTVGRALNGRGALMGRARRVMAQADSIRTLLGSSAGGLGRFRRDSTLAETIADVRNELTIVRALLEEPRGTLGRATRDSAILNALGIAEEEMGALVADMKRRPFRYLSF